MKQINLIILAIGVLFVVPSCSKDDPIPELDQEEVGTVKLIFTEVEREAHGDHYHYNDIDNPAIENVVFELKDGEMLPPVETHLHLEVGKTYRLELLTTDFAGRESQHTFVDRADIHQAFILKNPTESLEGTMEYAYADRDVDDKRVDVGVTGYLTVVEEADTFVLRYVMRHLNPGVKENITTDDWSNTNFMQFTGANDLDLKVAVHLISEHGHDH